jgi:quercetin dioxygenase-like cupin family protein
MTQPLPLDWPNSPWERVREGVERKLCNGQKATMALHRVSASATLAEHVHAEEQIVYVVSGRLGYSIEDAHYELQAGDVLHIPGGVRHRSEVLGEAPAVTLDVFVPARSY